MRRLSIITLILLTLFFAGGLIFYYKMGAFEDPDMKVIQVPACVIAGQPFKGKTTTREFGKLFNDAEKLIGQKKLKGTVCGVFYSSPENGHDETEAFVGVILSDTTMELPSGYTKRYFPARRVVEAHIANIYGSPLIYPKIEDYAEENKLKLKKTPALEIYPPTKEVFVQVPVE